MADVLDNLVLQILCRNRDGASSTTATSISDSWGEAAIVKRLATSPALPDAEFMYCDTRTTANVHVLCDDTVAKTFSPSGPLPSPEARALEFVRKHTTIPVPKVRRCFTRGINAYLLLEKIDGTRLDKLWPFLPPWKKLVVVLTLRNYIQQLRRASNAYPRRHVPGPMGDTPRPCHGPAWLFGDRWKGPFRSSKELIDHYNQRYKLDDKRTKFEDSYPLVLMHGDLNLRNVVVGREDGKLWLVDWEWSGFYPPWFEYIATLSSAENDSWSGQVPPGWTRCIAAITGVWEREKWLLGH